MILDWTLRFIPGHVWIRVVITRRQDVELGHGWIYEGIVRRDAWRIGPFGFAILRLPCIPEGL